MIKFFRKIRQGLLFDNKIIKPVSPGGRYLLYAIGEIILVVVGILIALQINNWNEGQKAKRELKSILKTIDENLISDLEGINQELINGKMTLDYWESVLENTDSDSLNNLFIKNITLRFIPVDNSGFTSIVSNNKLGLISNTKLKSSLTSYYGIDFIEKERFTSYLSNHAKDLTLLASQEAIKIKEKGTFGKRMTLLLENSAFTEMTASYIRLYKIVLENLVLRKEETQVLLKLIRIELDKR